MMIGKISICVVMLAGLSPAWADTDKYNITQQEHQACDGDAARLCLATYPDEDKLLTCMRSSRDQLTPVCRHVFETGMKRRGLPL